MPQRWVNTSWTSTTNELLYKGLLQGYWIRLDYMIQVSANTVSNSPRFNQTVYLDF